MNTHGHGKIADDVGLPLLVAAFKARGYERIPLNAFPLGNWLTDVQQAVDPVALNAPVVKKFIRESTEEIVNSVFLEPAPGDDILSRWVRKYQGRIERVVRDKQAELELSVDALFTKTGTPGEVRRTKLYDALRTAFRVNGYFRFVHPVEGVPRLDHEPSSGYRLDPAVYFGVFEQMFTQYWPYEHLDRPEVRPPLDPIDFRSEIASGPRAGGGSNFSPDLYAHLREDLEIAAGRIARVELELGVPMFDLMQPPRAGDLPWNLSLAMLGRAMHAPEDFFAHSLFTEFCLSMLGSEHIPDSDHVRETMGLRMQQWQRELPNRPPPAAVSEPNVVTGWFDIQDTIISLSHMVEDLFGKRFQDPALRLAAAKQAVVDAGSRPDILVFDIQELMYEASETLDDPQKAMQDRDNKVAQRAREFLPSTGLGQPVDEETVRRLLSDSPAYRDVPDQVKTDMVNQLIMLHAGIQIGRSTITAYKAVRNVYRFFTGPIRAVTGWLGEALGDEIDNAINFAIVSRLEALAGSRRIGCHSLLSKDYEDAPLYDQAWQLAAAMHWYVLSVMTRQHPSMTPAEKQDQGQGKGQQDGDEAKPKDKEKQKPARPKASKPRHVDWFDLLEFFLRHPAPGDKNLVGQEEETCIPIEHVVDNRRRVDSLATLGKRYRKSACASKPFTWRSIADANFATAGKSDRVTQRVVNHVLATSRTGYVVRDGINYAFNPGLIVIIPDQRRTYLTWELDTSKPTWWQEVIERKTWRALPGYSDPERRASVPPIEVGYEPRLIDVGKAALQIESAEQLRLRREKAYQ